MEDGLARAVVGLPVAALWPLTVPYLSASRARAVLATTLSAAYVLAPRFPEGASWFLLAAAPAVTLMLAAFVKPPERAPGERRTNRAAALWPLVATLVLSSASVALLGFDDVADALGDALNADRIALVAIGAAACVFIGGSVVAWFLAPSPERSSCAAKPTIFPACATPGPLHRLVRANPSLRARPRWRPRGSGPGSRGEVIRPLPFPTATP